MINPSKNILWNASEMSPTLRTIKSLSIYCLLLFVLTGCKTSGWTAWLDSDSMTPSLSFDVVPKQSEPPIAEGDDDSEAETD